MFGDKANSTVTRLSVTQKEMDFRAVLACAVSLFGCMLFAAVKCGTVSLSVLDPIARGAMSGQGPWRK